MRLRAVVVRRHSDDFPGWVEASVRDAHGREHRIIEKAPVLSLLDLTPDSRFPITLWIDAEAVGATPEGTVVKLPYGMETTAGETTLVVSSVDPAPDRQDQS